MPKSNPLFPDPLLMTSEILVMRDLQWVEYDKVTVHSVLHSASPPTVIGGSADVLTCGAIRQGGGRWIDLKHEPLQQVTCLFCLGRGGTPR